MVHYYANVITRREEIAPQKHNCELLLLQTFAREEPTIAAGWKKIWEGNRPGDKVERYHLYLRR